MKLKNLGANRTELLDAARMENKTTHTPGPWTFEHSMEEDGYVVFPEKEIDPSGRPIALLTGFKNGEDARLIAAAPELLSAARNALNILAALAIGDLKAIKTDSAAIAELRAAIAKAEGR
jgi:hypothetical protein